MSPRSLEPTTRGAATRTQALTLTCPASAKGVKLDDIRKYGHVLTPGRYAGSEEVEDDGEPFEEKMERLTATLRDQIAKSTKLDATIVGNLKELGYGE